MSDVFDKLPESFKELYDFQILSDLDIYMIDTLARRYAKRECAAYTLLACALASRVVSDSHVCLKLTKVSPEWLVEHGSDENLTSESLSKKTKSLCRKLADANDNDLIKDSSGLIGNETSDCPIIVTAKHIYLRRYWKFESAIASRLKAISQVEDNSVNSKELTLQLDNLKLEGQQRIAATTALQRQLTVISGGPGTGKTYVAARILYLLMLRESHNKPLIVRMAAPTGKAAANLDKSVNDAMKEIEGGKELNSNKFKSACTIDRLLGYDTHSPYFIHNHNNPLRVNVLLIDEASMIDLPKMAKLLDALPENCRLILLGDMHQLASVAPGSVMADICSSIYLKNNVIELNKSRRFPEGSPVHQLEQAINKTGDSDTGAIAWNLLTKLNKQNDGSKQVTQHAVPEYMVDNRGIANHDLSKAIIKGYKNFIEAKTPEKAFKALSEFRILCALRHGPHGITTLNRLIEDILSGKAVNPSNLPEELRIWRKLKTSDEFYDHRVLMITKNDYSMELFNGDMGIVMSDEKDIDKKMVWFEGRKQGEKLRRFHPRLLPEHDTAFAITIHKAQGSEFGHVLLILPQSTSKILTKELIYTGITRTKGSVDLWANQDVFNTSVEQRIERSSGLLNQLDKNLK